MKYADAVKKFDPVIGLETHVELSTKTKLFCPAEVHFGGEPNTQLTPVSLGLPGSLPVVNKTAVDYAIKLGLALHCEIAEWSQFARKNYFYPDMPRDYQISQYDKPTNGNGYLDVELEDGTIFRVPIERAHIEDDAGKNTHVGGADGRIEGADHSLVDYNRAGVPLIEIVTKPIEGAGDRAPEIAGAYMRAIRDIVRALNISHARMEQGNMRADVNVSLRNSPSDPFGTRSETKNVNSFRGIEKTIQYEIRRQAAILSEGGEILQETRHWDEASQTTAGGRVKSDADDYRYFPDPDLVMLHITKEHIEEMKAQMPEMPRERRNRLKGEWGFNDLEMRDVLNADALDLLEDTVKAGASASGAKKWWLGELSREANNKGVSLEELPITPADVAEVESQCASDDYLVTQQENNLALAEIALSEAMNYPADRPLVIDTDIAVGTPAGTVPFDDVLAYALDNHPKALAAGYDVRHSRLQFSVAKGNLYPSISVGGGYSTNFFMNLDDRTQYAAFPAQFRDNRGYYFSAQLSIPIFGGLSRRTSLNRARNNWRIAELRRVETLRALQSEIAQAYQQMLGYGKEFVQASKKSDAAQLAYDAVAGKYERGMVSALDLQTAADKLLQARSERLRARLQYIVRVRLVEYYNGEPLIR